MDVGFPENGSNDFLETWHLVRYQNVEKNYTAGFSEKCPCLRKIAKTRSKLRFFGLFSKTALTIFKKSYMKIEEIDTEQLAKTAHRYLALFAGKSEKTGENIGFLDFSRKVE